MSTLSLSPPRLVGVLEAARALSISTRHLRALVARHQVRAVRLGRRLLIPIAELERLAGGGAP